MKTLSSVEPLAQAERLCRDYAALAAQIRELTKRAESGDWLACDEAWDAFARSLETQLAFEEAELLPRYLASGGGDAGLVARSQAAHEEMRRELLRLGVELQLHVLRPGALRAFLEGVRERRGREVRALCAWAESRPEGGLRGLWSRASEAVRRAALAAGRAAFVAGRRRSWPRGGAQPGGGATSVSAPPISSTPEAWGVCQAGASRSTRGSST